MGAILLYSAKDCKTIGSEIRKLRAFRDSDWYVWCQSQENSWHQELLHSRTAGVERVKYQTDKETVHLLLKLREFCVCFLIVILNVSDIAVGLEY